MRRRLKHTLRVTTVDGDRPGLKNLRDDSLRNVICLNRRDQRRPWRDSFTVTRKGGGGMKVLVVCDAGVERHDVEELPRLLERQDAVIWVDIPVCDERAVDVLSGVFGFHRIAVRDCVERNHVSKVHVYPDHVFSVLHAPQVGQRGHVHYVELDQFIGRNYLITVHGPINPAVQPEVALMDTGAVLRRIEEKHLHIGSPFELSHWIVSALIRRESDLVASLAMESGQLEQRVMLGEDLEDPEEFLEELFQAWYRLLAVRTMATHSSATYGRMARLVRFLPDTAPPLFTDLADQFAVVTTMADGQREFLHGVIEFYQTRTSTHMTIAAERTASTGAQQNEDMRRITAWVAIVAVPTAVTSFFGQNVPYPGSGKTAGVIASALIIVVFAAALYIIFKQKKWL
jgi:magnesium transporter